MNDGFSRVPRPPPIVRTAAGRADGEVGEDGGWAPAEALGLAEDVITGGSTFTGAPIFELQQGRLAQHLAGQRLDARQKSDPLNCSTKRFGPRPPPPVPVRAQRLDPGGELLCRQFRLQSFEAGRVCRSVIDSSKERQTRPGTMANGGRGRRARPQSSAACCQCAIRVPWRAWRPADVSAAVRPNRTTTKAEQNQQYPHLPVCRAVIHCPHRGQFATFS